MVDNNMPHEVLRRFERIEARLDALEGGSQQEEYGPQEPEYEEEQ